MSSLRLLAAVGAALPVIAPDGQYYCDDDGGNGDDPVVSIGYPLGGDYRVWVGTFETGAYHNATLSISEMVDR
jgi:hypothetical protein